MKSPNQFGTYFLKGDLANKITCVTTSAPVGILMPANPCEMICDALSLRRQHVGYSKTRLLINAILIIQALTSPVGIEGLE